MGKPEVQPLHPLILRVENIVFLLFFGHSLPLPIPYAISPNVECLYSIEQENIVHTDTQQYPIAPAIQRLIVIAINISSNDIARLHKHVVESRGDGACTDGIRVLRVPTYEDGVAVRIGQ